MWTAKPSASSSEVPTLTKREKFVAGLRAMADFYESTPELELPHGDLTLSYFIHGDDAKSKLAEFARLLAPAEKLAFGSGPEGWYVIRRQFGPWKIDACSLRKAVCTPRVVRTEHVPEKIVPEQVIPARDVDVVEWDCPSLLADTAEAL